MGKDEEGYDMIEVSKGKGKVSIYDECPECGESKGLLYYDPGGKCMSCGYTY